LKVIKHLKKRYQQIENSEINKLLKEQGINLDEKFSKKIGQIDTYSLPKVQGEAVRNAKKIVRERFEKNPPINKSTFVDELKNSKTKEGKPDIKKLNLLEEELTNVSLGSMNKQLV
jgi:hypothetical protein